ncbi:MAG: NAD(P)-binding domain-containing protein [Gemmatimonadaceae bacterium]
MISLSPTTRVERYRTLVVGGGQAGLAVGYELQQRDDDFLIVDGAAQLGESWRRRWDSLRLFTPAKYSALPGMPFPADPASYPDKDQVADYMESYAERFDLPVRRNAPISSLSWNGKRFVLRSTETTFEASNVVVATGPFQSKRVPILASQLSPHIHQLHSSEYVNPHLLPAGSVLVVGVGNSGAQIAMELGRTREVWLAGQEVGHAPRRLAGRDLYDWTWPILTRATVETALGRALQKRFRRGDPLIGITRHQLVAAGVTRVGRVTGVREGMPEAGATTIAADIVIWATGFAPDYQWINLPVFDERGLPRHRRGVVPEAPGLYFLGLRFQSAYTSALLGGVGRDASYVADLVTRNESAGSVTPRTSEPAGLQQQPAG